MELKMWLTFTLKQMEHWHLEEHWHLVRVVVHCPASGIFFSQFG